MIDPKYAAELRRRFQMDAPPQADNPVVDRVLVADRLQNSLFARDSAELFDPTRSPQMYAVAQAALRELHARMGEAAETGDGHVVFGLDDTPPDRVRFDHHDGPCDEFTPLNADDPAVYVWFVDSSLGHVIRGPKPIGAFDRATVGAGQPRRGVDYYAGMLRLMMDLREVSTVWPRDCNIKVSRDCDGPTQLLPYRAGVCLLVFECCEACLTYAQASADKGYELSEMEAYARAGLSFP